MLAFLSTITISAEEGDARFTATVLTADPPISAQCFSLVSAVTQVATALNDRLNSQKVQQPNLTHTASGSEG